VVSSAIATPVASGIPVVHNLAPASKVRPAPKQVLAPTTLAEVERVLHEQTVAINRTMASNPPTTCTANIPPITGIRTPVPEKHASITTMLKHLNPHKGPSTNAFGGFPIAP
jgi:hypothetical protein